MKKTILLLLLAASSAGAQITLHRCYDAATSGYPLRKKLHLAGQSSALAIKNLENRYLPELSVAGQARYQSDVTKVNLNIPIPNLKLDIPTPDKDQESIYLNINQLIWDGGAIKGRIEAEKTKVNADNSAVEAELYGLYDRINKLYFRILISREQIKSLYNMKSDLEAKHSKIQTAVDAGAMTPASSDQIQAEILKISQNINEAELMTRAAAEMLADLAGIPASEMDSLETPADFTADDLFSRNFSARPDIIQMENQKNYIGSLASSVKSRDLPVIAAFAQAGWGKPGLNMFDPDFASYYFLGVRASWNFWNWGSTENELQSLSIGKDMIDAAKETICKNLTMQADLARKEIEAAQSKISSDREIINLRTKILRESELRLENGTITMPDYLNDFNSRARAILDESIHKLNLLEAKYNALNLYGLSNLK